MEFIFPKDDLHQFARPGVFHAGSNPGMVPEHKHEKEEEVMFFIEGKGEFVTKDETIQLKPGICVYNPPGEFHKIVNTGDEVLKFIWIYAPQLESHRAK